MRMSSFELVVIFSSCLVTVFPLLGCSQHLGFHEKEFYILPNKSLVGNITAISKVKDYFECSFLCLQHGPLACLSFNFGKVTDISGYYTCEISSSERHTEPGKLQDRHDYDYYGLTTDSILRVLPCTSSPCKNGGTCTRGSRLGEFSCQCGVEISVLPFIDNMCNVDSGKLGTSAPLQGVLQAYVGVYNLNYYDARRLCEMLGATLATYNQLYAAWEAGLQRCAHGWLADGTAGYPMQKKASECGDAIGIIGRSIQRDKIKAKLNAWCYQEY